ncbi:histone-lysine N-methyltransferase SETD2-like [Sycon ciliatum]|uniref:histone-lysine N-methyltransferase SETD2-like n=1 Tax=Sycon ciliatum TaxID=27933 RepID=UPI0031F5FB7B
MDTEEYVAGPDDGRKPAKWEELKENVYLNERKSSKNGKRDNKMQCDCEIAYENGQPILGCGEDCINRLLMIECNPKLCEYGEFCQNQRFQKRQHAHVEQFNTGEKGWGLRAKADIAEGAFVLEYIGEVCSNQQFQERSARYHLDGRRHHYFMTLRTDEIIDATLKGSISRFINHSCEPNCETQKWTVNGHLRIGFFCISPIKQGEELTFDYQFQRSGEGAQPCYCGSTKCRGIIGGKRERSEKVPEKGRPTGGKKPRTLPEEDEFTTEVKSLRSGSGVGIREASNILPLSRLMVTADRSDQRLLVLQTLLATGDEKCLKMFMRLQGLSLLWSWMVDCEDEKTDSLASSIIDVLSHLPVASLNPLLDSKVLSQVRKWSTPNALAVSAKSSGASTASPASEATVAATPNSPVKTVAEPSSLGVTQINGVDEVRCHSPANDSDAKSSPSPTETKRTPPTSDSGVGSPDAGADACDSGTDSNNMMPYTSNDDKSFVHVAAQNLLEKWSELKEVYRIPKKTVQQTKNGVEEVIEQQPPAAPVQPRSKPKFESSSERYSSRRSWSHASSRRSREHGQYSPLHRSSKRWDGSHDRNRYRSDLPPSGISTVTNRPSAYYDIAGSPHSQSGAGGVRSSHGLSSSSPQYIQGHPAYTANPVIAAGSAAVAPLQLAPNNLYALPNVVGVPDVFTYQSLYIQHQQQQLAVLSSVLAAPLAEVVIADAQPMQIVDDDEMAITSHSPCHEEEVAATDAASDTSCDIESSPLNLPSDWSYARDQEGRVYYYHLVNRQPQWERPDEEFQPPLPEDVSTPEEPAPPLPDDTNDVAQNAECRGSSSNGSVPTSQPKKPSSSKRRRSSNDEEPEDSEHPTKKTSLPKSERNHEAFRADVSVVVIQLLNPYLKPDCKQGRIQSPDDFKYLARKLTHEIVQKEMKHKPSARPELTGTVRDKVTKFVRSYMKKCKDKYERVKT